MVPWKSSFYLKPWDNKGNFVYLLQKRRVMGHGRWVSTHCSTRSPSVWLTWSQDQAYLFAQHLVKWHLSGCTRAKWRRFLQITANTDAMNIWRDCSRESHIDFIIFIGISLRLLLSRFCGGSVWFYCLYITCTSSATLHRTIISLVFRKCHPVLQWAAVWVLVQAVNSWVYGVDLGAGRNYR